MSLNTDNILIIDKPKGWTSNDVVQAIKRKFKYHKVGHAGTLDPNATGVLVIGINEGTKQLHSLSGDTKEYIADIQFGIETDSYDVDGKVVEHKNYQHITRGEIEEWFERILRRNYIQYPPKFSAKKVNGRKLYEFARQNQIVEIKPSKVKLLNYEIINFEDGLLKVKMHVSKGFYIRSLAHDIGQELKSVAMLANLRRIQSGIFSITEAVPLNELINKQPTTK